MSSDESTSLSSFIGQGPPFKDVAFSEDIRFLLRIGVYQSEAQELQPNFGLEGLEPLPVELAYVRRFRPGDRIGELEKASLFEELQQSILGTRWRGRI